MLTRSLPLALSIPFLTQTKVGGTSDAFLVKLSEATGEVLWARNVGKRMGICVPLLSFADTLCIPDVIPSLRTSLIPSFSQGALASTT